MRSATDGDTLDVTTAHPVPTREASTSGAALAVPDVAELLADLEHPRLVFSDGYVGPDRRSPDRWRRIRRATFGWNRPLLRLEILVAAVAAAALIGTFVLQAPTGSPHRPTTSAVADGYRFIRAAAPETAAAPAPTPPVTTPPATVPASSTPPPVPATVPSAASAPAPAAVPAPTTPAAPAASASMTPQELGAQALTLVRYPWQSIPGYSIQFLPITDAPSAGFLGNTTFTWGSVGGVSSLYVYPGEPVEKLAGIIAFEIGHEVDAGAVQPAGGEAAIESILGIHPASWAPNCDCSEQNFLSGWYAAAFSNYWSPGVGNWSALAPEPSGAQLTAVAPWLNPAIP